MNAKISGAPHVTCCAISNEILVQHLNINLARVHTRTLQRNISIQNSMYPHILVEIPSIKPEYIHPPTSAKHLSITLSVSIRFSEIPQYKV
jgi:hypothetical protein